MTAFCGGVWNLGCLVPLCLFLFVLLVLFGGTRD